MLLLGHARVVLDSDTAGERDANYGSRGNSQTETFETINTIGLNLQRTNLTSWLQVMLLWESEMVKTQGLGCQHGSKLQIMNDECHKYRDNYYMSK